MPPKTHLQDHTSLFILSSPATISFSFLTVHVSSDPASGAHNQNGYAIAWSVPVERALLDWIPVMSRLCTISFVRFCASQYGSIGCHCSLIISLFPVLFVAKCAFQGCYSHCL